MTSRSLSAALSSEALAASMTFTDEHRFVDGFSNCGMNPHDIYEPMYANVPHFDTRFAVCYIPPSADTEHATAFGAYVKNDAPSTNGVGGFFNVMASATNVKIWGINTLQQDNATRAIGSLTGVVMIGAEFDQNVMCPDTTVIGGSVGGNSLSAPKDGIGWQVCALGTGIPWPTAFFSHDGAATLGMCLGALAVSGASVASQPIKWNYFNAAGDKKWAKLQASDSRVTLSNNDAYLTFSVQGYINVPAGKGIAVADQLVVRERTGGFTAMTGTASKGSCATYDAPTADGSLAQVQALMNAVQALSRRMKAMDEVEFWNGRIGA